MTESAPARSGTLAVKMQLEKLLASSGFRNAPVLGAMLRCIVSEALDGNPEKLDANKIARKALGKGPDFQSSQDSSVRVAANRLRAALRLYYAEEGRLDDVVISLLPGSYEPEITFRSLSSEVSPSERTMAIVDRYQATGTKECNAETLRMINVLLTDDPENPVLLAAKADLLMDAYKHGYSNDPSLVETADLLLERAKSNDPCNGFVSFTMALAALYRGEWSDLDRISRALIEAETASDRALGTWTLSLISSDGAELCEAEPRLFSTFGLPGWLHHAPFLVAYSKGDYEAALISGIKFGMTDWFWGSIDRSAALAQLGLQEAAGAELKHAVSLCPNLLTDPDRILGAYIPDLDTRSHVMEGLEKAGIRSMA